MIQIIYKEKNYNYEGIGKQPYDIETKIDVIEDAYLTDVLDAMIKILKISGYHIDKDTLIQVIEDIFDNE